MEKLAKTAVSLTTFADIIGAKLTITRFPNDKDAEYRCSFKDLYIRDSSDFGCLCAPDGKGCSPLGAMYDYVDRIRGKWCVFRGREKEPAMFIPKGLFMDNE